MFPEAIKKFIDLFSKLPSIGPRLATRLAFYLINLDANTLSNIELAVKNLKKINRCERCFFLKESYQKICSICADPKRNKAIIAVVEKETDILTIEKTGYFKGNYLILGDLPERGILESFQKLRFQSLKNRIKNELDGKAKEIIIAVSQNTFGDFISDIIRQEFKNYAEKISRISRGIPTGGEIEFADEETIRNSFDRRA